MAKRAKHVSTPGPAPTDRPGGWTWTPDRAAAVALTAILLLGAALRLYQLGKSNLWFDEALSVNTAFLPIRMIPDEVARTEQIPPLFHVIMHVWINRYGGSDFSARMPALLFGLGSVWLIYKVGRILYGHREGCAAALLLAVSSYQVLSSQEARPYTLLTFTSLWSTYAFVRVVRQGGGRAQLWYVVATGLMLWSHLYAVFTLAAQWAAWLYLWRNGRRGGQKPAIDGWHWLGLTAAAALVFSPWIPTVIGWTKNVGGSFWIPSMTASYLPWVYYVLTGSVLLLILLTALAGWGAWKTEERWKGVLLVSLLLLPVVAPYVLSIVLRPLLVPRYGIVATAGLCLLAARGLTALPARSAQVPALLVACGLSLWSLTGVNPGMPEKAETYQASKYVTDTAREGDFLLLNAGYGNLVYQYYLKDMDLDRFHLFGDLAEVPPPQARGPSLWIVSQNTRASVREARESPEEVSRRAEDAARSAGWVLANAKRFAGGIEIRQFTPPPPR